jgi:hypothetical protein
MRFQFGFLAVQRHHGAGFGGEEVEVALVGAAENEEDAIASEGGDAVRHGRTLRWILHVVEVVDHDHARALEKRERNSDEQLLSLAEVANEKAGPRLGK